MNTGAASKGPEAARLGFKLRALADRVRALENRRLTHVGGWRLEEDPATGALIAHHPKTGTKHTLVLATPEEG